MSAVRHDDPTLMSLRAKLETEIGDLKVQLKELDARVANLNPIGEYYTAVERDRGRVHERLTQCMVTHDTCWPNAWFVLKTLEDFYTEAPLH
jgi:hypothetical protein